MPSQGQNGANSDEASSTGARRCRDENVTIPFAERKLLPGTWQQVVLLELDYQASPTGVRSTAYS